MHHRRGADRGAGGDRADALLQRFVGTPGEEADGERTVRAGGERRERLSQRHPNDTRFAALDTEAVLKAKVPDWLAALKAQFDQANAIIEEMNRFGANNADVRPLVDELQWIGKLESFVAGRGGPDAPIRMYADEDRIGEILQALGRRCAEPSALARPHRFVRARVREPYAQALSHLRKLQSDDSVYLAAIDRLKASIARNWRGITPEALQRRARAITRTSIRASADSIGCARICGNYLDLQTQARGRASHRSSRCWAR